MTVASTLATAGPHAGETTACGGPGTRAPLADAWDGDVAAILMLWYPGQEGGHAVADVLLGRANPSDKLPFTVPKSQDDLPLFDVDATEITYDLWHGYRKLGRDGVEPAYPFGFGLSYTSYALANLRLAIEPDGKVVATVDVTNTGDLAGEEVVQPYNGARGPAVERAPKELKAFSPGWGRRPVSRTVHLAAPAIDFAYNDTDSGWIIEPGDYETIVGRHSMDEAALRASFTIRPELAYHVGIEGAVS